jgi:hypothetical protein
MSQVTSKMSEDINDGRRRLLGTAAMGIAAAGSVSLLPGQFAAAQDSSSTRLPGRASVVPDSGRANENKEIAHGIRDIADPVRGWRAVRGNFRSFRRGSPHEW